MEQPMAVAARLAASTDALGALAAYVRIETEGLVVAPEVRELLAAITSELLGGLPTFGEADLPVVGLARSFLRQAAQLVDHPSLGGQWAETDEALLQGLGRLSMGIAGAFRAAESSVDGLGEALGAPGARFLDVGTGTGWLAIATARAYPELTVVGLDRYEAALGLARTNVAASSDVADRIELRHGDVAELADVAAFDAIWLPLPFLPGDVVPKALAASRAALKPGGWLLPGTFVGGGDRLSDLLTDLRIVRSGGVAWTSDQLLELMAEHGFRDVREVPRTWPGPPRLFAGRAA